MNFNRVAEFTLKEQDMPESAMDMAALLLIDTIGVAAGAVKMEAGRIARDYAFGFHGAGSSEHAAHLMFDGRQTSIPGAAFAGATQIDNLDAHDGYNPTKGHIGCAVVPALLAFAEARPTMRARDALRAMIVAYEISARAGISLHASVADYHTSGAWNALGVAALGCRIFGTNADHLRHAFGIAEYHGPRSQMMREIANPTMLHDGSGMGALVGCMSVMMAQAGFTGAPALTIEAEDASQHWSNLGAVWTIESNYIKPYPICRWAHAALDALSTLMRDHCFSAEEVTLIAVRTFAESAALFPGMPATASQAQYSLPFALAAMLVHGQIGPDQITGAALNDQRVSRLLPRIAVHEDARHSDRFPKSRWSDVTVTLKDGRKLASGDVNARGGPEAPMELEEAEAKFRMMAATLSEPRITALWDMRERLTQPDTKFSELSDLVRSPVEDAHG